MFNTQAILLKGVRSPFHGRLEAVGPPVAAAVWSSSPQPRVRCEGALTSALSHRGATAAPASRALEMRPVQMRSWVFKLASC